MPTTNPPALLILDLEATGDDERTDAILEIGAILVSWAPDLPELSRGSMVVRPPGSNADHDRLWSRMIEPVRAMHRESGLWMEATTGTDAWDPHQADNALGAWLAKHVDVPIPIAGCGVGHFDLRFVRQHLPRLASKITYWPVDFSDVRRALQLAGRDDYVNLDRDVRAKPHRAMGDCELHLAEARRYVAALATLPPAPAQ